VVHAKIEARMGSIVARIVSLCYLVTMPMGIESQEILD